MAKETKQKQTATEIVTVKMQECLEILQEEYKISPSNEIYSITITIENLQRELKKL